MKKKVSILVIICILVFGLIGCDSITNADGDSTSNSRFLDTGDKYTIARNTFEVWYDSNTEIVYLVKNKGSYGTSAITIMYDADGKPMTIDKYKETK